MVTSAEGPAVALGEHFDIREAPLDSLPPSLHIPESLASKLSWVSGSKTLRWVGELSTKDVHLLKNLSRNRQYQAAVRLLCDPPRPGGYNKGAAFVSVFRWALLLLVAEIVKRIVEGMYEPLAIHPKQWYFFPDEIKTEYAVGFLQFITTLLIVFRYFTCLVDWIWRYAGISKDTDLTNDAWVARLWAVQARVLFNVAALSSLEFILIYHASKAVHGGDVVHWLHFLILLVIVDSVAFFLPNVIRFLVTLVREKMHTFLMLCVIGIMKVAHTIRLPIDASADNGNLTDSVHAEIQMVRMAAKEQLHETNEDYGIWNLIDFTVLAISLGFLYVALELPWLSARHPELWVSCFLAIATLLVSWLNLKRKYSTYLVHFTILGLRPHSI